MAAPNVNPLLCSGAAVEGRAAVAAAAGFDPPKVKPLPVEADLSVVVSVIVELLAPNLKLLLCSGEATAAVAGSATDSAALGGEPNDVAGAVVVGFAPNDPNEVVDGSGSATGLTVTCSAVVDDAPDVFFAGVVPNEPNDAGVESEPFAKFLRLLDPVSLSFGLASW